MAKLQTADTPAARAWRLALEAQRWLARREDGALPTIEALGSYAEESPLARYPAGLACASLARANMLAFDREGLRRVVAVHKRLVGNGVAEGSRLWLWVHEAWLKLFCGEPQGLVEEGEDVRGAALRHNDAALVLEAVVVKAMASLISGDMGEAVTLARRASRMARTEAHPQQEYLANLVLARIRRVSGKPHLASLILTSLLRVASSPWRRWLSWELFLAHGQTPMEGAWEGTRALSDYVASAIAGDRARTAHFRAKALEKSAGFVALEQDVTTLCLLLESDSDLSDAPSEVLAWLSGARVDVPDGLSGLGGINQSDQGSAPTEIEAALVWAPAGSNARRLLNLGRALLPPEARDLPELKGRQARTDSTVAALLLVGPGGISEDALFQQIYGFTYDDRLHRGVRDVLYSRVRSRLEGRAHLVRKDGLVALHHDGSIVAPDPRCSPGRDRILLWLLAQRGTVSAKDAAKVLNIPVRTAQDGLRRLVGDGICRAEKVGRRLEYHLEDTTFQEPTQV